MYGLCFAFAACQSVLTRLLPPDEWCRLSGTDLAAVWQTLRADHDRVIVVEHEGEIIGCWTLISIVHCEGIWIDPRYRNGGAVARRLLHRMPVEAREMGAKKVMTMAWTPEIAALADRIGAMRLPGEQFLVNVEAPCQP